MIKSNINEFIGRMTKRGALSSTMEIDTPADASAKFIIRAKNRAPRDTGETVNSIKLLQINGKMFRVVSIVSGRFKQNLWTNRSPPFAKPKMVWNNRQETTYGDGSHNTTGMPEWWTKSAIEIGKEYKSIALKRVNKTLHLR